MPDESHRGCEQLGVRSLDAIHLACARRLQVPGLAFVTFDLRQAQAARSLGFTVLGA
jgi:predicted nucleic acid-binding protein